MSVMDGYTPPPEGGPTGDVMQAFPKVWRHVQVAVEFGARELTKDRDLRDDLIQEAKLELLRLDPSRCDIQNVPQLRELRTVLINHMKDAAKSRGLRMDDASDRVPEDLLRLLS